MILDEIIYHKKKSLRGKKHLKPLKILKKEAYDMPLSRDFLGALRTEKPNEVRIIAEIKKASPSKGIIRENASPSEIASMYQRGGADAISVLTEDKYFMGNDEFLRQVKKSATCPVLRKDFIIDPYQIYESKVLGADAVLLIAAVLGSRLKEFYNLAESLGLGCLVEIHDEYELQIALDIGAKVIGINNRDLRTFKVNIETTERLVQLIPGDRVKVSESGIKSVEDIRRLKLQGVDAFLIGEALMVADDVEEAVRKFKAG